MIKVKKFKIGKVLWNILADSILWPKNYDNVKNWLKLGKNLARQKI